MLSTPAFMLPAPPAPYPRLVCMLGPALWFLVRYEVELKLAFFHGVFWWAKTPYEYVACFFVFVLSMLGRKLARLSLDGVTRRKGIL